VTQKSERVKATESQWRFDRKVIEGQPDQTGLALQRGKEKGEDLLDGWKRSTRGFGGRPANSLVTYNRNPKGWVYKTRKFYGGAAVRSLKGRGKEVENLL